MSDNSKEAEKEMEKAIFISADCWLKVFDLLPRFQLGLGIAMISHRFDYFVEEHFKTRKWALMKHIEIRCKIEENGANKMEIVNSEGKTLPIPQNPLPKKVTGFRGISITFFDQKVLTFLRRFHRFFAKCETKLYIATGNIRILEFVMRIIWPMFKDTIREMRLNGFVFHKIRQLAPSLLNDCPSLRVVTFYNDILPEFPLDDSANASDGQALAKWLFTPRLDNLPKALRIECFSVGKWSPTMEQIKAAFSNASSPVAFVISVCFLPSFPLSSVVVPFELINELTGEKLTLTESYRSFELIRCPIAWDTRKKAFYEELNARQNQIEFGIGRVDDGLLDNALAGSSGDH